MATCLCVQLAAAAGRLTYASAGHPPALLRRPDGTVERLTEVLRLLLLLGTPGPRGGDRLEPGSVLGMYTDGLVDAAAPPSTRGSTRWGTRWVHGGRRRRRAARRPRQACGLEDDVALLVAHAVPVDRARLDLSLDAVPGTLAPMRRAVRRWLDANGVGAEVAYDILLAERVGDERDRARVRTERGALRRARPHRRRRRGDRRARPRALASGAWPAPRGAASGDVRARRWTRSTSARRPSDPRSGCVGA